VAADERKRTRSPAYPFIGLEAAIRYTQLAYQAEDRHPFAPEAAATYWDYTPSSSAVGQIISALKQYGLLDEEGANGQRRLRLTRLALDLIVHEDESDQRADLLKKAALSPKIHWEIWDKYGGRLPSDATLRIYLLRERDGAPFNKDQVDRFISQLRETIQFAMLTESDKVPPSDGAVAGDDDGPEPEKRDRQPPPTPARQPMQPGMKEAVLPLTEGDVIVRYPDRISTQSFEDLEDWMQLMIRRMKRAVGDESSHQPEPAD
jgi:hypothetical protein